MKIECLVADVTAGGSLDRAERAILGGILTACVFGQSRSYLWFGSHCIWPIQVLFVVGEPLCCVGTPS